MAPQGDAVIGVQVDASRVRAAAERLPKAIRMQFGDALDHISRKFLKNFRAGTGVKMRTRGLWNQFKRTFDIPGPGRPMAVEIFTTSKIAKLHETGGTVTGKGGLRLAVPLSSKSGEVLTGTGKVKAKYGGTPYNRDLRKIANLRPIRLGGKTFIARVNKRTRDVMPLFVLKSSVQVPARLKFYDTWEAMRPDAEKIVDKATDRACREAWR